MAPDPGPNRHPSRYAGRALVVVVIVAVLVAGGLAYVIAGANRQAQPARTRGIPAAVSTPLATLMKLSPVPAHPAPEFTLTDQSGRPVSGADFRGRAIVLEFMDPHCTDICPIISQEFVDAYHDLGAQAAQVVFLAVNVNPFHTAVADVASFSHEHRLDTIPSWHFLTGPDSALEATWSSYGVSVDAPSPDADVIHSSFVYFIDPDGNERYLGSPEDDHRANGDAYLPGNQIDTWGEGIAATARSLLAR
ncbi:MAG: SCO family protein [Acidimicrobiales bacterium]